jgi:Lar family restriction alleviation protein
VSVDAPEELLSCPFCGSITLEIKQPGGWMSNCWIECDKCGAMGPATDDPQSAWAEWNDRATPGHATIGATVPAFEAPRPKPFTAMLKRLPWPLFWTLFIAWFGLTVGYYKGFASGAWEMRAAIMCTLGSTGAANASELHKWCDKKA